ncbi:MAG: toll/interleukin-1 receptor domain-containing protein [Xanthomonadales bacterium]|jgi:hypothetical protein|nr:toll/interleukin-1 receptor domain-containing protein [Xanthomonadales bacterium]
MATEPGPFEVFLSYARKDNQPADPAQGWVTALHRFIQSSARLPGGTAPRVFFDTNHIRDFEDWRHRILDALRHSKVLLVCLSPNYFASDNCASSPHWKAMVSISRWVIGSSGRSSKHGSRKMHLDQLGLRLA